MSLLIAIKENEKIRYISVDNYYKNFDKILATLKNFYTSPERVKALIDLGNLEWLGISPYKKSKGEEDVINCESKIRDKKLSPGKHGSQLASCEKDFVKAVSKDLYGTFHCGFLYENDRWYILVGNRKEDIRFVDESILAKDSLLKGLTVYKYDPKSSSGKLSEVSFYCWNEIQQAADTNGCDHYIFRGDKLIKGMKPQQKQTGIAL